MRSVSLKANQDFKARPVAPLPPQLPPTLPLTTPPGWVFYLQSGRPGFEPHFTAESHPCPRPHSWHKLDLTQLATGWLACLPGASTDLLQRPNVISDELLSTIVEGKAASPSERFHLPAFLSSWDRIHPSLRCSTPSWVWTHFLGLRNRRLSQAGLEPGHDAPLLRGSATSMFKSRGLNEVTAYTLPSHL